MAKTAEIIFSGDTTKLRSAVKGASSDLKTFGKDSEESSSKLSAIKSAAVGAALGGISVLTAGLTKSFEAANQEQQATVRMRQAFKDAGVDASKYKTQIDAAESSGRNLGFTNEQVQQSLGSLVLATHSGAAALKDLGVVEDLARFKHIDLTAASKMITMAMGGSSRAAKQLGINIIPVTTNVDALKLKYAALKQPVDAAALAQAKLADKQLTAKLTIDAVSKAVKGQAAAYAGTAAGGMARFHAQIQNIEAAFGQLLLPIMMKVIGAISSMVDWMGKHKAVAIVLAVVIGGLAGAIGAVAAAEAIAGGVTGVWTAAQWLLNTALDANPIALVVVAIAGLVAGIGFLVTKTNVVSDAWKALKETLTTAADAIKNTVTDAWNTVRNATVNAWDTVRNTITGAWDTVRNTTTSVMDGVRNAISNAWGAVRSVTSNVLDDVRNAVSNAWSAVRTTTTNIWDGVKGAVSDAWNGIKSVVSGAISTVVGFVRGMGSGISSIASGMWNGILSSFKSVINTIIGWWDSLHFTLPKVNVGPIHLGGGEISVPKIPYLASGGNITGAGAVLVGEAGPELLNLPTGARVTPLSHGPAMGGRGRGDVNVNFNGPVSMGAGTAAATRLADRLAFRAQLGTA